MAEVTGDQHAHPGWYGAVMSTAVLSVIVHQERIIWNAPWMDVVAVILLLITTVLAVFLAPRYLGAILRPGAAQAVLGDPDTGSLLATVPAGILLLAAAWGTVGPMAVPRDVALGIDALLGVVGAVLALWIGMMWSTSTGRGSKGLAGVNGSWLIPPVCTMLVALAVAPLVSADIWAPEVLILVGYAFLGAGLVMFLVMLSLLVARLILDPEIPAQLAPTMWVPLAPAGILGIAAIRITEAAVTVGLVDKETVDVAAGVAALAFGFGLWWALYAALDLNRQRKTGQLLFQPGWWAFIFPPAAMLLSLLGIEELFHVDYVKFVTAPVAVALLCLWVFLVVKSIPGLGSRKRS